MIEVGNVVKSIAGRDRGRFFVVLEVEDQYCLIADGKIRKLALPKKKKQKHLSKTNTYFDIKSLVTDKKLRIALKDFNLN